MHIQTYNIHIHAHTLVIMPPYPTKDCVIMSVLRGVGIISMSKPTFSGPLLAELSKP